ncbi:MULTISPECIES: copper resistance protein NlpE [Myroides]|uniref:copper resistance protein NlpE n=1 Tax=Myroides odoratus TaxID=256 RepID=UPI0024BF348B|nr:copper resistance protein NlpE [Myroides sp. mNGS23_01]WHT39131.1 copper resistance protein NlpE [Myroides sp. mNGS23_01]
MKRRNLAVLTVVAMSVLTLTSCKKEVKETTEPTAVEEVTPTEVMADNSKTSLDWAGTYKGTIPCADCPGIDETIVLNEDGTFKLVDHYQDRKDGHFEEEGKYEWDTTGNKITLTLKDGSKKQAAVHEGSLLLLDQEGNEITGNLAENYRLKKQ